MIREVFKQLNIKMNSLKFKKIKLLILKKIKF